MVLPKQEPSPNTNSLLFGSFKASQTKGTLLHACPFQKLQSQNHPNFGNGFGKRQGVQPAPEKQKIWSNNKKGQMCPFRQEAIQSQR